MTTSPTYVLVDGENIDATLGMSVLGRRPNPEERPRWDRILTFAGNLGGEGSARGLFFLNASTGQLPMGFVQALLAMGYTPIPLASDGDEKVVDVGIQRTLDAIAARESGNVLLASHDGDFIPQVAGLLNAGHRVGMLCFREFLNSRLGELSSRGLQIYDLETDIGAFTVPLPRIRIIPLAEFDPNLFL
ncbi:MAG TPA: NYN domain-containing protein [Actinomycetaceae bacterium]|nr:NYN domain-containing protein [Actinomycetaceae bacterium]